MTAGPADPVSPGGEQAIDLLALLDIESIDANLFRNTLVFEEPGHPVTGRPVSLYGGQVAAQALIAAGRTVAADRRPHSLHGYFLRPGDSRTPTLFKVFRDRDGRSFSARRVVAVQDGEVIFSLSSSFQVAAEGALQQAEPAPPTCGPDGLVDQPFPRLHSMLHRLPEQPYEAPFPTRFWSRSTVPVPDQPLQQCAALTYLSDISTGVLPAEDGSADPGASLDHAVWFHAPADLNDWVLSDYQPRVTGHGRGWYTGSVHDRSGVLVASLTQEVLYR